MRQDAGCASNRLQINPMFLFDIPIHKFIIHFPIALTIIAAVYDAWAIYSRKPELHRTGYGLTLWAAVAALAAALTAITPRAVQSARFSAAPCAIAA